MDLQEGQKLGNEPGETSSHLKALLPGGWTYPRRSRSDRRMILLLAVQFLGTLQNQERLDLGMADQGFLVFLLFHYIRLQWQLQTVLLLSELSLK